MSCVTFTIIRKRRSFYFFFVFEILYWEQYACFVSLWSLSLGRRVFCHFRQAPCLPSNPHKFPFTFTHEPQRNFEQIIVNNKRTSFPSISVVKNRESFLNTLHIWSSSELPPFDVCMYVAYDILQTSHKENKNSVTILIFGMCRRAQKKSSN